jgi:hypothetical protein
MPYAEVSPGGQPANSVGFASERRPATLEDIRSEPVEGCFRSSLYRVRKRRFVAVQAAIAAAGIYAADAGDDPRSSSPTIAFHIPSQPLASALQVYGEKAGVQVLYESRSALGRTSAVVEGSFTPHDALALLLAGTDLKVQYIRPNAITLAVRSSFAEAPAAAPPAMQLSLGTLRVRLTSEPDATVRFHDYNASLQLDIQDLLQKNARTRAGNYRAALDLWIDPLRTVQRIELVRSTGSRERDTAVIAALRGVTVSRPTPANVPQPVRVTIVVSSAP